MPRLTQLDDLLFPVEEHPVFVILRTKSGEHRLPVPEKKGLVNVKTDRVLGIVGREYRLVTNSQALEWAQQCCRAVFPETKPGEWQVDGCDAPGTGGHCFIDFVHNSTALDFKDVQARDRPEIFGPFIRVINSYNGLRALTFEIGFFRKVCKNGLIIPQAIITFKFTHQQKDIRDTIKFEISIDRVAKLKASFSAYLGVLRDCLVRRLDFEPLFFGILLIRGPKDAEPVSPIAHDWRTLSQHISLLCDRYMGDLGENAYAVLNAVTDFASHPLENRCVHRDRNSFQRLAGVWLTNFSRECKKPDFTLSKYLDELAKADGNGGAFPQSKTEQEALVS